MGGINPEVLPSGASKIMRLNVKGRMLDILTYDEQYEDIDGNTKSYIPADWVCVTAPNAGRTIYGAITQLEQADGQFHTYAGIDVPKFTSTLSQTSVRSCCQQHLSVCRTTPTRSSFLMYSDGGRHEERESNCRCSRYRMD